MKTTMNTIKLRILTVLAIALALIASIFSYQLTAAEQAQGASNAMQQAVQRGVNNAAAKGITQYVLVIDRYTGEQLAWTNNAWQQVASESLVKMHIASYWLLKNNGNAAAAPCDMWPMITISDNNEASKCWRNDILSTVSNAYGLYGSENNPGSPGYWGATHITAADTAWLIWHMLRDPKVSPWLANAMNNASDWYPAGEGSQNYGFNALSGWGSKQGTGNDSYWVGPVAIHSAGFNDSVVAVVMQTGPTSAYNAMFETATYSAIQINNAAKHPDYLNGKLLKGAIAQRYWQLGGQNGKLGLPTTNEICNSKNGGCYQLFQNGAINWSSSTGAWETLGAIRSRWLVLGGDSSSLGLPVSGEVCSGGRCYQFYEGGAIDWVPGVGAWETSGAIRARWVKLGSGDGKLGFAVGGEVCGRKDGGCYQLFQNGAINWSSSTGAWETVGAIRTKWLTLGAENGQLGYPTSAEYRSGSVTIQNFEGGRITWTPTAMQVTITSKLQTQTVDATSQTAGMQTAEDTSTISPSPASSASPSLSASTLPSTISSAAASPADIANESTAASPAEVLENQIAQPQQTP